MPQSDLDKELENANLALKDALDELDRELESANLALNTLGEIFTSTIDNFSDAGQAYFSEAEDEGQGFADILESNEAWSVFNEQIHRLTSSPDDLSNAQQALVDAFEDTALSVEEFEEIAEICDAQGEGVSDAFDEFITSATNFSSRLGGLLPDALNELEESVNENLNNLLAQQLSNLFDESNDILQSTLKEVVQDANLIANQGKQSVNQAIDGAISNIESRIRGVLGDEVEAIGRDIIEQTLNEIIDDVVVTQLSAQLTTALSGQLPQLIAAKQVVGAVRKALEILRAGV